MDTSQPKIAKQKPARSVAAADSNAQLHNAQLQPRLPKLPALPQLVRELRVAIVSDAIDGRNGVGTYYPDLVQHLGEHLDAVELIAPQNEPDSQLEQFALPMPGDSTQRMAWPRRKELYRRLDEFKPNVIVIPSLGAFSYFAMRYARRKKIGFAIVNHTNFDHLLGLYWPKWMAAPFRMGLRRLNAFLCREASGVAAMNADAFQKASRAGSSFTRVMGTPLAFDFLTKPTQPMPERLQRTIFVGRLAEEKGISKILDAAKQLPQVEFVIAGDGPLRKDVEKAADKMHNVVYQGWLSRVEVMQQIDQSQLLLLPSIFETFGTVALEALARRRFVLASKDCGIVKWPTFSNGIFCIDEDETLADAILRLREMPESERLKVAQIGWDSVDLFNEHTIRNWLKFLCDTVENQISGAEIPSDFESRQ